MNKRNINVQNVIMSGKLNAVCPGQLNAPDVKVKTFIRTKKTKTIYTVTEENKGSDVMSDDQNKGRISTGFLYCPRCGLRRPKVEMLGSYGGYCPSCRSKMIEEGDIPYVSKPKSNKKKSKDKKKEGISIDKINSINGLRQQTQLDKKASVFSSIPGVEKADNRKYENEIREYTEAIHIKPNDAYSYFIRATMKVHIGDIEGARRDFKMSENCHHNNKPDL